MEKVTILPKEKMNDLPKTAGVYLFYSGKEAIYIGKAINIRDRVKNHFQQPSYRDDLFIHKVEKIGFLETESEIEALVLESQLIKKNQPKFNVVWRDDKNYFFVAITKGPKPVVVITHQKNDAHAEYIGPFIEGTALKKTLKFLRRVFPYYTSAKHPKNKCTWCHLGLCPGPDPNLAEYKKNIKKLSLILKGQRKTVLYSLKKEMAALSQKNEFEKAGEVRDKLYALEQVMSHRGVISSEQSATSDAWDKTQKVMQEMLGLGNTISRIECYDISNIQGKNATGSMVVFVNGAPERSQYKKFRIRMKNEPNDIAMLREVLTRRFSHPEWNYPEVMLIDGGIAQLNVAIRTKSEFKDAKNVKIISIAKGKRELLIEGKSKIPLKKLPQEIYNAIVALDDEAHRFAITYHKELRKRTLLK